MSTIQMPQRKPRLSLQIKTSVGPALRTKRGLPVDPLDPTALNTLSNVYVTAIERSTPVTAINTFQNFSLASPVEPKNPKKRIATPYMPPCPETPLTAYPQSPDNVAMPFPSAMTATPPMTAAPADSKVFSFSPSDTASKSLASVMAMGSPVETRSPRRKMSAAQGMGMGLGLNLPYIHPRSLHSILRNSPLPPVSSSPRRQSLRLQERAAKRVEYNNPLTQEIINNKYIRSHIDLLVEDASPLSPPSARFEALANAFQPTPNVTSAGSFEPSQRRSSGSGASPAAPAGIRKRPRKDKKRRWVWTIGRDAEDEDELDDSELSGAMLATKAEALREQSSRESSEEAKTPTVDASQPSYLSTPTPSVESIDTPEFSSDFSDTEMSDSASSLDSDDSAPCLADFDMDMDVDVDAKTPTATKQLGIINTNLFFGTMRDSPIPELGSNRNTPVPHH